MPVDPYTYYVDIMISPSGQVIQAGSGGGDANATSNGLPSSNLPFYHFWLTDRQGVVAPLWDSPAATINATLQPGLEPAPQPSQATRNLPAADAARDHYQGYAPMPDNTQRRAAYSTNPIYLKGERRLITLFTKSGQIVTNSIESLQRLEHQRPVLRGAGRDQGAAMIARNVPGPRRSGITLTEILIAILIMGIGLISLATLFPLGLIRLRDAARFHRGGMLVQSASDDLDAEAPRCPDTFYQTWYGGTPANPNASPATRPRWA